MIIKKLKLHNFGVYAGDNEFVFEGSKPIILIGGMNGRGKTTFLEAVLLALYGQGSFAYSDSEHKSYSGYLRSFVNRGSDDGTCSVTLEFEINNGVLEHYMIQRTWNTESKRAKEQLTVRQLDTEQVDELIRMIKKYDSVLDNEYGADKAEKVREAAKELEVSVKDGNNPKHTMGILSYIRDLSVNAGGGLIAAGILQLITTIMG